MAKVSDIISALKSQLEDDSNLSYVKKVFTDLRDRVVMFPTIFVSYMGSDESFDIHDTQEITAHIAVVAVINVTNQDKSLVGDSNTKGLVDIENDIKKAISSNMTLGVDGVVMTKITSSRADEFENYPVRSIAMNLEVIFRQNYTTRT